MTRTRTLHAMTVTAMMVSLANAAAAQQARPEARPAEATRTMLTQSGTADTLPDPALGKRWTSLTEHLLEEFRADHEVRAQISKATSPRSNKDPPRAESRGRVGHADVYRGRASERRYQDDGESAL